MRWIVAPLLAFSIGCSPALLSPVERPLPEPGRASPTRVAQLEDDLASLEAENERLRRQIAELEERLEASERTADASRPVLHDRLPGDGQPPAIEVSDLPLPGSSQFPSEPPAEPTPVESGPLSLEAQELYDRGYTFYHRGMYLDAEGAFQQFLGRYSASELADNAHYWIGEARFARADYRGALAAFRETVARYPQGNKVPDSLLKAGDCLARMGEPEAARRAYAEVSRRYPASAAALTAQERSAALE